MKQLETILLIDDDAATNFLHKFLLEKENCAKQVLCMQSAEAALEFVHQTIKDGLKYPELIFLDINMPRMNGWEFIEAYNKLTKQNDVSKIVVMLTTSLDPSDSERANKQENINMFLNKPLTREKIKIVLEKYNLI